MYPWDYLSFSKCSYQKDKRWNMISSEKHLRNEAFNLPMARGEGEGEGVDATPPTGFFSNLSPKWKERFLQTKFLPVA